MKLHPSEQAQLERETHHSRLQSGRVSPLSSADSPAAAEEVAMAGVGLRVRPGSIEEERALDRIAERRYEDRASLDDSFAKRRKRAARYWGRRGTL